MGSNMASISITWKAQMDDRTCPICKALNGHTWVFVTGKNMMTDSLTHPSHGEVWNTTQGSQAHGHTSINCRCSLDYKVDVSDIHAKLQTMMEDLEEKVNEQSW